LIIVVLWVDGILSTITSNDGSQPKVTRWSMKTRTSRRWRHYEKRWGLLSGKSFYCWRVPCQSGAAGWWEVRTAVVFYYSELTIFSFLEITHRLSNRRSSLSMALDVGEVCFSAH
jgi:hypothetical protein